MSKLTNNGSANAFEKAPESGVDFYLSFWKEAREDGSWANLFNAATRETTTLNSPDIGACLWLGHIVRLEGRTDNEPTFNVYSTYFEKYNDFIQIWKKKAKDEEAKAQIVYEGAANDEGVKKEMKYLLGSKSGYTIYLLLISAKAKLIFAKVDGMNIGQFFDFQKSYPDAEYLQIADLIEQDNPKKKGERVYLLKFVSPEKGPVFSADQQAIVTEKIEQLSVWLDHILYYARNGKHKDSELPRIPTQSTIPAKQDPEPPELNPEAILAEGEPAPVATDDDDLPF